MSDDNWVTTGGAAAASAVVTALVAWWKLRGDQHKTDSVDAREALDAGWQKLLEAQARQVELQAKHNDKLSLDVAALQAEHAKCLAGQERLQQQIELLRLRTERVDLPAMAICDADGLIVTASASMAVLFKRPLDQLVGQSCRVLMTEASWRGHEAGLMRLNSDPQGRPPGIAMGDAIDGTGHVFSVIVDTTRSFVSAQGRWTFVAEFTRARASGSSG